MAKTTKQVPVKAGESGGKSVTKKTGGRKVPAKKAGSTSAAATKTASARKARVKKSPGENTAAKKTSGKSAGIGKAVSTMNAMTRKSVAKPKALTGENAANPVVAPRQVSSSERLRMIAEAAYLRGESQGFLSNEQEDWLLAEAEIDSLLMRTDVTVSD